jgi:hypothetical protein
MTPEEAENFAWIERRVTVTQGDLIELRKLVRQLETDLAECRKLLNVECGGRRYEHCLTS